MVNKKKTSLGMYVHVPFCGKVCDYCDFFAISAPNRLFEEYLDLISKELSVFAERNPGVFGSVETLYIGGGTPSILPPELLSRLISSIEDVGVPLKKLREFTMEFNPESCTEERLAVALEMGLSRASVGIQSFDENLLSLIGRSHKAGTGEQALSLLTSFPGLQVNGDLMFNLPQQTLERFLGDLDKLSDYPLGHVSFYGLKVDPASRLGKRVSRGELFVDEDLYAPMYMQGVELLERKGILRYETSNFARPGCESIHNLNYWRRGEYLAFGPSAHGFFNQNRFFAPEHYARWREYVCSGMPSQMLSLDPIGPSEALAELVQLSLRMAEGLSLSELSALGYCIRPKAIEKWVDQKYLVERNGSLKLFGEGWLFMDRVVEDLFCNCVPENK